MGNEMPSLSPISASISKKKGFISRNIGKLTAGALFLTAVGVYTMMPGKELKQADSQAMKKAKFDRTIKGLSKEQLIALLPGAWKKFFG